MNEIVQHIPNAAYGGQEQERAEFGTLAELLAVPFVARWAATPGFIRFCQSPSYGMPVHRGTENPRRAFGRTVEETEADDRAYLGDAYGKSLLMVEWREQEPGKEKMHWVVGYMKRPLPVEQLPAWKA